ncbi:MAG: FhaA domain-containing protein [Acidimicrobiales bacterium]
MGLRDLERAIERGVDGMLGRVFKGDVSRIEIAKRVERELEAGARRGTDGSRIMPNDIEVRLHPDDANRLESSPDQLRGELFDLARRHARGAGHGFEGPLVVRVTSTAEAQRGTIEVYATAEHAVAGVPPGTLVYPDGYRFDLAALGTAGVRLGRGEDADIVIDDDKASREHAYVNPSARGWVIEDLDSTNGTRVNGFRASIQLLSDGDHITVGATTFLFDAS